MSTTSPESERTRAGHHRGAPSPAQAPAAPDSSGPWVGLRTPAAARLEPAPPRRSTWPPLPAAGGAGPGTPEGGSAAEPAARERSARPSSLAGAASWELDLTSGRLDWTEAMHRLVGTDPADGAPTVETWFSVVHHQDRPRVRSGWMTARETGRGYQEQFRIVSVDGVEHAVHAWTEVQTDLDGRALRMFGALVDLGAAGPQQLRDALTGLPGRGALEVRAAAAVTAARPDRSAALLIVDLDHFGRVNDTYGRRTGDLVLALVAGRLRQAVPSGAVLVRLGGDEFAVLLSDLPTAGMARDVADDVLGAVQRPIPVPGSGRRGAGGGVGPVGPEEHVILTATVGLAISDGVETAVDADDLCHHAELALHRAKADGSAGRGTCVVFRPELHELARRRVRTESMLRSALAAERMQVLYQPVIDLTSGEVCGVEALCRVVDPQLGPLSPALFMDVAEETGLVTQMDEWVLRRAAAFATRWTTSGAPEGTSMPTVAVNMSPQTLARPGLALVVAEALEGAGAAGRRLLVEITEHSLLDRDDALRATLGALERLGVAVGVDDFGTGWSSLSYLAALELGFLKIDRSFVARLGQDEAAVAVVRAIIELAHAHRLTCIAEGVETQAQAVLLAGLGCDHGQGWWFGRPMAEADLDGAVAAWHERSRATGFGTRGEAGEGARELRLVHGGGRHGGPAEAVDGAGRHGGRGMRSHRTTTR